MMLNEQCDQIWQFFDGLVVICSLLNDAFTLLRSISVRSNCGKNTRHVQFDLLRGTDSTVGVCPPPPFNPSLVQSCTVTVTLAFVLDLERKVIWYKILCFYVGSNFV